jgi:hypothetical protein
MCEAELDGDDVIGPCALHHFHEDCLLPVTDGSVRCPGCYPDDLGATEPVDLTDIDADTDTEPLPVETLPVDPVPVETLPVDPVPVETLPVDTPVAGTSGAETPADLGETQRAAAARLVAAITRAKEAASAAEAAVVTVVDAGIGRAPVTSALDQADPGWTSALPVCASAGDLASYAGQAGAYEPTAEVIAYLDETAASYDSNAAVLEAAQRMLDSMTVVSMGKGVQAYLSAQAERNVAELAVEGPGGSGHNLHPLSRGMKGWWSLRAEGGRIVIVRWSNDAPPLQVARTGAHDTGSGGDVYKYDQTLADDFSPVLAWTDADKQGVLG